MSRHTPRSHWLRQVTIGQLAISALGLMLAWLVLSKSLSFALAERAPGFALWLNPSQPRALLTLAGRKRAELLKLIAADAQDASAIDAAKEGAGAAQAATGHSESRERQDAIEARETLREEIRALARRVIGAEPLTASAFRLLAEATSEPAELRPLMEAAMQLSRRESKAVFWLMDDSLAQENLPDVIEKADILLRTRPKLQSSVMRYLEQVANRPEGRALLVPILAKNPAWRPAFLNTLTVNARATAPRAMLLALKEAGSPPVAKELAGYLNALVANNLPEIAYDTWLQFIPPQRLASIGLLNNAAFADDPSGLPFDWSFQRGQNAIMNFVPLQDRSGSRALRLEFGVGRVRLPEASQLLLLPAGRYRLEGVFQGQLTGKRGLRWEFRCLGGKLPLAETEMIYGAAQGGVFTVEVDVPPGADCQAQRLRLYHHARSPSEELISGEIVFRGLNLRRLEQLG